MTQLPSSDPRALYLEAEAELISIIGQGDVPPAIAYLSTCGALTALHKCDYDTMKTGIMA
jgi:hypothetical protein